jgi:integrase
MMKTHKLINAFFEAKHDLSDRTREQYQQALEYLERECPKFPSKPQPLRSALYRVSAVWVRDSYWRVWKSFFHWCWWEYDIPNPMQKVDRPDTPDIEMRALEPRDLAYVLAASSKLRDKAIISLAIDSGIRASEFGRLRIIDIGRDTIWVWGKRRKRVQVPISPETSQLLNLLIDERGKDPGTLLFTDNRGRPMSRFSVYRIVRKCMDKAGIAGPKRGPHCFRHSLGTNYIASGGDPFTLKRIMRHNNISTTQKYVNLAMRTVVEHHRQHSPLREALRASQGVLIEREVEEILNGKEVN